MKHIKKYNSINESEKYIEIDPLTIQEFSFIRESLYAVKNSDSPSAFQAKEYFKNEDNFNIVVEKLRKLLTHGSEKI